MMLASLEIFRLSLYLVGSPGEGRIWWFTSDKVRTYPRKEPMRVEYCTAA